MALSGSLRRGARARVGYRRKCDGVESGGLRASPRGQAAPTLLEKGPVRSNRAHSVPQVRTTSRGSPDYSPPAPPLDSPSPPLSPSQHRIVLPPPCSKLWTTVFPFPPVHLTGLLGTVVWAVHCTKAPCPRRHHLHPRLVYLLMQFSES